MPEVKKSPRKRGTPGTANRVRPAGENDPNGIDAPYLLHRREKRSNLTIDHQLADATRYQLGILGTKIKNKNSFAVNKMLPIFLILGACPRIRRHRVPSAAGADARRRDAGDVDVHRRGAPTPQMPPRRRNPKGAWGLRAISALLVVNDVHSTSPPPRALSSPRKPHARDTS